MKLIYFAWLKQRTGTAEEEVTPPKEVTDVAALLEWLKSRGPGYAAALRDLSVVRVAVNQEFARLDHRLEPGDEVALFPPVTGG
ncbi:MAG TPA: molybdopterin converting factor subunit 1 [Alphaproteobacteria bacterium]|jgi:sulfur-carrier protein|nr:molybdopterin converting factor subunit 1 [Alphaproteobacteria bacterium]